MSGNHGPGEQQLGHGHEDDEDPRPPVRPLRAFAVYSGLRLVLLVMSYGVLLLVGLRGLLAVGAAVLLSALLSLVLLRNQRDAFTAASIEAGGRRKAAAEARRARLVASQEQLERDRQQGPGDSAT